MKLNEVISSHHEQGKIYFRRLVMELTKRLPPQLMFRVQPNKDAWHLRAEGFMPYISAKSSESHPYRVDVDYGEKHPIMSITAHFPTGDVAFRKKLQEAIKASNLEKFEGSQSIDNGFFTAMFTFTK